MATIEIDHVSVRGNTVSARVSYSRDVRRFFAGEECFVEYDVDVSEVPAGILPIPVLAQICPVAWATGSDVHVPVVDRRFLDSLRTIESVFREMYPSFMEGGAVTAARTEDTTTAYGDAGNVGTLFTGGVDSLATYIRHRETDPTLVTVQGWTVDIDDDEWWNEVTEAIETYAEAFGAETQFVRSNMLEFLETPMLSAHFSDQHDGGWYSAVGSGLGLLGLCAPLTVARDMGRLYIAASAWEGMEPPAVTDQWDGRAMPWGSHPDIDDRVAWGNTRCVHDGFEHHRQERVDIVAEYVETDAPDLPIRSCMDAPGLRSCNECEKCLRTALELVVAGLDPNRHGFDIDRESFQHAITQFKRGNWLADQHGAYYWEHLQDHLSPTEDYPLDGLDEFVDWMQDVDFASLTGSPTSEKLLRSVGRHTPYPVYATLGPLYRKLPRPLRP